MHRIPRFGFAGTFLLVSLFAGMSAPSLFSAESNWTSEAAPLTGPATLTPTTTGKARVWVFLSAKCPCSNSHLEKLKATHREFADRGFEFIGVHANQDEPTDLATTYFKEKNLGFPVFHDPDAKIAGRFGALKTPHLFVEDRHGKILYEGGIDATKRAETSDENFLRDALLEIEAGKSVTKTRTKTLGCVISRRKAP